MKPFIPLTELAREAAGQTLANGALAVDATVGNGHDTLFLASRVGRQGHVVGFDVQALAIGTTAANLASKGLESSVTLLQCGHERMLERLPEDWPGRVSVVMFNLGYLPGADKQITTDATTTIDALNQALSLLRAGGLISLLVYRGHPGAGDEAAAVSDWLEKLDAGYRLSSHDSPGPILHLIRRPA